MTQPSDNPARSEPTEGDDSPVTGWLRQLEAGEAQAAQPLYERFCTRLKDLARQRIPANIRGAYDQDDVAISAFHSLFLGVREQRYRLDDRSDFWRLLITIAERKIAKRVRHEHREKRDVRRVVRNSMLVRPPDNSANDELRGMESLAGREPTPEFAAEVSETCESLLASLPDETARRIALLKLENHTADEIAAKMSCARRTVQRKLLVIRRTWQHAGGMKNQPDGMSQLGNEKALEE